MDNHIWQNSTEPASPRVVNKKQPEQGGETKKTKKLRQRKSPVKNKTLFGGHRVVVVKVGIYFNHRIRWYTTRI